MGRRSDRESQECDRGRQFRAHPRRRSRSLRMRLLESLAHSVAESPFPFLRLSNRPPPPACLTEIQVHFIIRRCCVKRSGAGAADRAGTDQGGIRP